MNTIPTSTNLVQRIEAALNGSDPHSSEVAGLIEAATAAEARFENLIAQLKLLLSEVLAAERAAAEKAQPSNVFSSYGLRPQQSQRSAAQSKVQPARVPVSLADPNVPF